VIDKLTAKGILALLPHSEVQGCCPRAVKGK
jgi:hypothetical protein